MMISIKERGIRMALAYVFWHRRLDQVSRRQYEKSLIEFHVSLREASLPGFLGSLVVRIEGAPWMASITDSYEDWYLLSGSEVMDKINDVAVSGARKGPHDKAARGATDTHGGLLRLVSGRESSLTKTNWTSWFSKPAGMDYDSLYSAMAKYPTPSSALWRRQMVLGPATEFCLTTALKTELPPSFRPIVVSRSTVWHSLEDSD